MHCKYVQVAFCLIYSQNRKRIVFVYNSKDKHSKDFLHEFVHKFIASKTSMNFESAENVWGLTGVKIQIRTASHRKQVINLQQQWKLFSPLLHLL